MNVHFYIDFYIETIVFIDFLIILIIHQVILRLYINIMEIYPVFLNCLTSINVI